MADQPAVLGPGNGSTSAKILFIAEAPGRFGAGRTGIPFSGDKSGENFETLLAHAGLARQDVFITNAVLCNPLKDGNNSRPTSAEIKNCSGFLRLQIELIRPRLVVTLGGIALDAVNRLLQTRYELKTDALRPVETPNFILLPLYHPSPRVANWKRPLRLQKRDFAKITKLIA